MPDAPLSCRPNSLHLRNAHYSRITLCSATYWTPHKLLEYFISGTIWQDRTLLHVRMMDQDILCFLWWVSFQPDAKVPSTTHGLRFLRVLCPNQTSSFVRTYFISSFHSVNFFWDLITNTMRIRLTEVQVIIRIIFQSFVPWTQNLHRLAKIMQTWRYSLTSTRKSLKLISPGLKLTDAICSA